MPDPAVLRSRSSCSVPFSSMLAVLGVLFVSAVTASAEPSSCEPLASAVLQSGEQIRTAEHAFEVHATYRVEGDPIDPDSVTRMDVDVLARYLDPATRRPFPGSYLPGLDARFVLTGPEGVVDAGNLTFRLSDGGPAYGTTVEASLEAGTSLDLEITLSSGRLAPEPHRLSDCGDGRLRIRAQLVVEEPRVDPAGIGTDAPADDTRVAVLGNVDLGGSHSDVWGWNNGTTFVAIIGHFSGTRFFDVTNPGSPSLIANIPGPGSSWRDIKTYQDHAYIVTEGFGTGEGLQIVDLVDSMGDVNPVLVNTYAADFVTVHNIWIDEPAGRAWLVGTNNGTHILDLSQDPVNPVNVGSWSVRYIHDAYVADGIGYFSEINDGIHEIADVSDPANIQILSSWVTPDGAAHNSWANDSHTLVATTDETTGGHIGVYDITVNTGPIPLLGEYDPNPSSIVHNVMFDDDNSDRIAIAHYALGFKYVDLSQPTAPVELASYDTRPSGDTGFNGAWGVYAFDPRGYFYVSDIQTGLYVLEYLATGGTLSVTVLDETGGTPITGVRVVLLSDATELFTDSAGMIATFVAEGEIRVRVSHPDYVTRIVGLGNMPFDGNIDADIDLVPLPATSLSGVVRSSGDSSPIEGVTVTVVEGGHTTTTAADGSYSFPAIGIGQRRVTAQVLGFAPNDEQVLITQGVPVIVDMDLEPGVFLDDAEGDLGWDLGQPGDTATTGQWERVDPNGTVGGTVQPEDDHTTAPGVTAFITGQSAPGANAETVDVDGGLTTLRSPTLDASALGAAQAQYYRWVSSQEGQLDGGTFRAQVSGDDGANWTTLEAVTDESAEWTLRTFDLAVAGALTDQVRLRFRCEAIASLTVMRIMECGVDDVSIVSACRSFFLPGSPDDDEDGQLNSCDACVLDPENDIDGDGFCGNLDNAPFTANVDQDDTDMDGVGDAVDNCAGTVNPDQRDLDLDGAGDACDADLDGDGTDNGVDPDSDNDGILDVADLCVDVPDPEQIDRDMDAEGDACDADDGEVQGVILDGDRILWEPEDASDDYSIYRGEIGAAVLVSLSACRIGGVPSTYYTDPDLPPPGEGFLYLVTRTVAGNESTAGFMTDGTERTIDSPCP